jgi:hypothetical protein
MLTNEQKELKRQAQDILDRLAKSFGKEETDLGEDQKTATFDYYYAIKCRTLADMAYITIQEI